MNENNWGESITIDVVQGGFILVYPQTPGAPGGREVFVSIRKLNQKLKEVLAALSFVSPEAE